jgi:hypothetical protein
MLIGTEHQEIQVHIYQMEYQMMQHIDVEEQIQRHNIQVYQEFGRQRLEFELE